MSLQSKEISAIGYDGSDRRLIVSAVRRLLAPPFPIAVFEETIYWTDWSTYTLRAANKFDGSGKETVHGGMHPTVVLQVIANVGDMMSVHVYHRQRQPRTANLCAGQECSQLCLPRKQAIGTDAAGVERSSGECRHDGARRSVDISPRQTTRVWRIRAIVTMRSSAAPIARCEAEQHEELRSLLSQ